MSEVIGVVHVRAAEGRVDEVVAAFTPCIEQTHQEEGCLAYALHRDAGDPNHLVLVERWRSQEDLDAHMTKPYVADLFAAAGATGCWPLRRSSPSSPRSVSAPPARRRCSRRRRRARGERREPVVRGLR